MARKICKANARSRAAVDEVEAAKAVPPPAFELSHVQRLFDAAVDEVEYRYSAPVLFVIYKKSVVIFAPGCVYSKTTELVVDEFA